MRYYYEHHHQPTGLLSLVIVGFLLGLITNPLATLAIAFLIAVYFVPTMIAILRPHPSYVAIFMLNLFVGWTVIGWIVALVWAFGRRNAHHPHRQPKPAPPVTGFEMPPRRFDP